LTEFEGVAKNEFAAAVSRPLAESRFHHGSFRSDFGLEEHIPQSLK
jgi:hypothetical protein